MLIAGINSSGYVSSAALVLDGELVFGCAEERLDRRKLSKAFPHRAIEDGLKYIGAKLEDIDQFAIGYNPGISISNRTRAGFSDWPGWPGGRFFSNPNQILPHLDTGDLTETEQVFRRRNGHSTRIRYVTHHLAHATNAFLLSGFSEAAIMSCDGYGERATTMWSHASEAGIKPIKQINYPHSIGSLYATLTQFLGFRPDSDEWKVMGAAAYGNQDVFYAKLKKLINWNANGDFELDLSFFNFFDFDVSPMYRGKLEGLLGPARHPSERLQQRHFDIAAGIQRVVEEYLFVAINWLKRQSGCSNVCLTGGVFMNSVFNGKAILKSAFDNVYVPFAPDDNGNSIGAALWAAWQEGEVNQFNNYSYRACIGRDYKDEEIEECLKRYKLRFTRTKDICVEVSELLATGNIVGWFQGRMEFGHRALGSRSILADPRDKSAKDRVNNAVKFREAFRPFAPAILADSQVDYFDIKNPIPVPYMEKVLPIRPSMRSRIPSVVHADGTGRLQTVDKENQPLFHSLISTFEKHSGVPVLLNTSFNVNNEPIVESPSDAVKTFYSSGLDALAIGPFLLRK